MAWDPSERASNFRYPGLHSTHLNAFFGSGYASTQVLKEQIQQIRSSLNIPAGETVPIVVGFLGWILDRTEISDDPRLIAVLDERPAAVWFAFGVDLEKYIDQVHAYNSKTGRNTFIFVIVNSVDDARRAALHRVDAVVVQGPSDCLTQNTIL